MTTLPPQENTTQNRNQCYCLNPACEHPENDRNAETCQNCGSKLVLQDRYRAIALIGQGGFGRTFRAIDESSPSQPYCAIKQFFPQQQGTSNTEKAAELFRKEATRLESLGKHPRIPKLLAYFEQDQRQYLIQEFIDGRNLAEELAEEGPFDETKIRQLLNDLLPILRVVHSHQVIHRDIKPENIIRRRADGSLFLVDFGAAKYTTETTLGRTGTVIGSAAFTAPEQVRGKAVFASDLYSLGVTCIHLLTQIPPFDLFDGSEDAWVWRHYLRQTLNRARGKNARKSGASVSLQLGNILDKMLQSATNKRYRSADEGLQDLNSTPIPVATFGIKKKWLVAGAVLVLGFAGVRYLVSPVTQMVTQQSDERSHFQQSGLFAEVDGKQQVFPLQHTEVMAKVAGNVSRVEVTQTFTNPFKEPLEAVYKFPLPEDAAVDDMEIKVGDRIIRGLIKKREEAKQIYQQAKEQGKTAGLLEQERDNIFTQSLANIKPGEKIDVTIRYTNSLKFEKGDYEFVFPMVVAPRYISNNGDNSNVANASTINPPVESGGNIAGQDIGVTVEIEAGVQVSNVRSTSHQIRTTKDGRILRVELAKQDTIPNKDLILRYQVAGKETQSTVLADADERGGHFATYLIPAVQYQTNEIVPKDVVFLMDTSGSQSGDPLVKSKELMRRFINGLNPQDSFTIIDFADSTTQLSPTPLRNTPENRDKALSYIERLQADGGTELLNGINTVVNFPPAPQGRLRSVVLITDGLVGDDVRAIAAVQKNLKPGNRLYSFGVGSSVNRFLIERLAEEGRGTAKVIRQDEPTQEVAEKFFQQINNPVLTNIEVSWQGSGPSPAIYPLKPADVFANQPVVLFGRKQDRSNGTLKISGIAAGGKRYEKTIPVNFDSAGNAAIAQLWGRARIKELMKQMYQGETSSGVKDVTDTALAYRLLSKYTAFVAVTEEVRVDPNNTRKMQVPVENPDGMRADTTSRQNANQPRISPAKTAKKTSSSTGLAKPITNVAALPNSMPTPSAIGQSNQVNSPSQGGQSSQSSDPSQVPEPTKMFGNILGLLLLGIYFGWKRLMGLKNSTPRP
jgi:Ca-activated chloride channel family protein